MCRKMDVFVSETSCLADGWMHALDDMSACAAQCAHLATNASFIWGNTNMTSKLLGPKLMFANHDKHYPSRSEQIIQATPETNFTKPVTKIKFGPSKW